MIIGEIGAPDTESKTVKLSHRSPFTTMILLTELTAWQWVVEHDEVRTAPCFPGHAGKATHRYLIRCIIQSICHFITVFN